MIRAIATGLAVVVGVLPSCAPDDAGAERIGGGEPVERVVVDGRGVALSVEVARERIVSLVPSMTETLVALSAGPALVGRTSFDRDPRIAGVPSVGGSVDPSVEAIVGARPDLVVTWADDDARALAERMESLGLPVYAAHARSLADFERHALALGRLVHRDAQAAALIATMRARVDRLRVEVAEDERPGVLVVFWPRPLLTTGGGTFADELIRVVGGRNAFGDVAVPWPTVSLEAVVERNPDVIVVASGRPGHEGAPWLEHDARWRTLDAVREGRVHTVDADRFSRPGPGMADAAEELARYVRAAAAWGRR